MNTELSTLPLVALYFSLILQNGVQQVQLHVTKSAHGKVLLQPKIQGEQTQEMKLSSHCCLSHLQRNYLCSSKCSRYHFRYSNSQWGFNYILHNKLIAELESYKSIKIH